MNGLPISDGAEGAEGAEGMQVPHSAESVGFRVQSSGSRIQN